ncbi:MAG: cytochrome c oxidase subunit 3 [Acidobacteriota bacterium]
MNAAAGGKDGRGERAPLATGRMGMVVLLASLTMLFAAGIAGYLVIRARAEVWPPPGVPPLPGGLWLSTVLILLSSATLYWAVDGIRHEDRRALRLGLSATAALGLAFLASQTVSWFALVAAEGRPQASLFAFTFFVLTVLHALHVVGGLVPLGVVTARAWRGAYTRDVHAGVEYTAMYWHYLDGVWLVLFAVLLLGS